MPFYDYFCATNNQTIEVVQAMNDKRFATWGELCRAKGIDPGNTPIDTPVKKLVSAHGKHISWSQWKALN